MKTGVHLDLLIPEKLRERIDHWRARSETYFGTRSQAIRYIIERYLDEHERPPKDAR